jgi:hypothetical protein
MRIVGGLGVRASGGEYFDAENIGQSWLAFGIHNEPQAISGTG